MTFNETLTINIKHTVQVNPEFIDLLLDYPDIFGPDYIGYWGMGIRLPEGKRGWLVVEFESLEDDLGPMTDDQILERWTAGNLEVRNYCHELNEETARRTISLGVRYFNRPDFQEDYDGNDLDTALQLALLDGIVYA